MPTARDWIDTLDLEPHPEGGYFRETYRSELEIPPEALPGGFDGPRPASTAIYFLLPGDAVSRFHRLRSDEVWHHYDGAPVSLWVLDPRGSERRGVSRVRLASGARAFPPGALPQEARPQTVVPAGVWFGATVDDPSSYALVGCTVAPGFDFRDFELAGRTELLERWPDERAIIERLTVG